MGERVVVAPGAHPTHAEKGSSYYGLVRSGLLDLIPSGTKRLLDVGCGEGQTSLAAKRRFQLEATGIELHAPAAAIASTKLDRVIVGDVETVTLDFPEGYFDCILCADVLEHTRDPWETLRRLRTHLSEDGVLIASIPNIRHISTVMKILLDRFEYQESGILDRTHLRFFTRHTIQGLFDQAGFATRRIAPIYSTGWKCGLLAALSLGLLRSFCIQQYVVVAGRSS